MCALESSRRTVRGQEHLLSIRELWEREVETLRSPTFNPPVLRTFEDWYTLGGKYATVAAGGWSVSNYPLIYIIAKEVFLKVPSTPY